LGWRWGDGTGIKLQTKSQRCKRGRLGGAFIIWVWGGILQTSRPTNGSPLELCKESRREPNGVPKIGDQIVREETGKGMLWAVLPEGYHHRSTQ